jgi:hypothetical protein
MGWFGNTLHPLPGASGPAPGTGGRPWLVMSVGNDVLCGYLIYSFMCPRTQSDHTNDVCALGNKSHQVASRKLLITVCVLPISDTISTIGGVYCLYQQ